MKFKMFDLKAGYINKKINRTSILILFTLLIFLVGCMNMNTSYDSLDVNSQLKELFGIRETQKISSQNVDYALKLSFIPQSLTLNVGDKKPVELNFELKMDDLPKKLFLFVSGFDPNLFQIIPNDFEFGKSLDLNNLKEFKSDKKVIEIEAKSKLSTTLYFFVFYEVNKNMDFTIVLPAKSGEKTLSVPQIKIPVVVEQIKERVDIEGDTEKIILEFLLHNVGQGNIFDSKKMDDSSFNGYDSLDDNDFNVVHMNLKFEGKALKCEVGEFINDYAKALCKFETKKPETDIQSFVTLNLEFGYINIYPYSLTIK